MWLLQKWTYRYYTVRDLNYGGHPPAKRGGGRGSWWGVPKMFGVGMWPKPVLLSPKFSFSLPYLRHKWKITRCQTSKISTQLQEPIVWPQLTGFEGTGVVIWKSWVQGLHPATSGICFLVVPSRNPQSRFVNSQLVCLLPVGIFNYVCLKYYFVSFVSLACL